MVTWIDALAKTRQRIAGAIGRVFARTEKLDPAALEDLEATLIQADIPAGMAAEWIASLEKGYRGLQVSPRQVLSEMLARSLGRPAPAGWNFPENPHVVLMVGINGSGKTTTCAKLGRLARKAGKKALLGATDTFRAAGSDQLRIWADRVGCEVVAGKTGADAAAVAFDAVEAAVARQVDVLFVDTAGRMHTRQPLMAELQKVNRAMGKRLPGAPHDTWIVLDASMGQNALAQAREFHAAVPLTGVVVSKLDGSAKAGFVFAIARELGVPLRYVGLGEGEDDLAPFDPKEFVNALLGEASEYKEPADVRKA
jgi:fused signal recognition particle receptor